MEITDLKVETKEPSAEDEAAAFASGYGETIEEPTVTASPVIETVTQTPVVQETVIPVDAPATISDAQFKELLAKVGSIDEIRSAVEKLRGDAFGKVGGLERTLKSLQDSTPIGQPIEVSASDLAELEAEFPGLNLGPSLAKGLTRVLSKMKGAGAPSLTRDEMAAELDARAQRDDIARQEEHKQIAFERLTDLHEDWQEVVGPANSTTEFRTWLKKEGAEKEAAFLNSWDPRHIAKVVTSFKERTRTPAGGSPRSSGEYQKSTIGGSRPG